MSSSPADLHVSPVPEFVDPYVDPETGILRNLGGARTQQELDAFETAATFRRLVELEARPVKFTGDLRQLKEIHRRIFQDVYDWAGSLRTVDLERPGSHPFVPQSLLQLAAGNVFEELSDEDMLKGLSAEQFVDRIAFHYDKLNHLHPFREGNGRTQRELWRQIGTRAGHPIDFTAVRGAVNDEASRLAGDDFDLTALKHMFATAIAAPPTARRTQSPPVSRDVRQKAGSPDGIGGQYADKPQSLPEISLTIDQPETENSKDR
jgi:cell filamentation protein